MSFPFFKVLFFSRLRAAGVTDDQLNDPDQAEMIFTALIETLSEMQQQPQPQQPQEEQKGGGYYAAEYVDAGESEDEEENEAEIDEPGSAAYEDLDLDEAESHAMQSQSQLAPMYLGDQLSYERQAEAAKSEAGIELPEAGIAFSEVADDVPVSFISPPAAVPAPVPMISPISPMSPAPPVEFSPVAEAEVAAESEAIAPPVMPPPKPVTSIAPLSRQEESDASSAEDEVDSGMGGLPKPTDASDRHEKRVEENEELQLRREAAPAKEKSSFGGLLQFIRRPLSLLKKETEKESANMEEAKVARPSDSGPSDSDWDEDSAQVPQQFNYLMAADAKKSEPGKHAAPPAPAPANAAPVSPRSHPFSRRKKSDEDSGPRAGAGAGAGKRHFVGQARPAPMSNGVRSVLVGVAEVGQEGREGRMREAMAKSRPGGGRRSNRGARRGDEPNEAVA